MMWLTIILHMFVGTTVAGVGIIGLLVTGNASLVAIGVAALIGYVAAIPLSVVIARAVKNA